MSESKRKNTDSESQSRKNSQCQRQDRKERICSTSGETELNKFMISSLMRIEKSIQNLQNQLDKASKKHTRNNGSREVYRDLEEASEGAFTVRQQLKLLRESFTATKFPGRVQWEGEE